MATLLNKVANSLSFAHLAGIGRRNAKAEGDKPEDDEKDKPDASAEGDDKDDEKDKPDASAEGDDPDASAESDDEKDKPEGKGKASDDKDEDDKDEEMRGNSVAASARRREQARCAAIFASPAAAKNPVLAANLAFGTRMCRRDALAVLEGTPAPAASTPAAGRAARNPNISSNASSGLTPAQAAAARWDALLQAANPSGNRRS